ncbi:MULTISPECIES: RcnB family protein [Pseudomonas]|jgi:Ni/Co efflux regulator RcnB|uniref:RcnB family protein n=1 Tax=Pseudomonas promysalinigenes TaxID=485898 RepID=A0ABY6AL04_9PSED|nr:MULTISPECIES: RcnB family protein [Pseudomonas]QXI32188.1 RcnB family protein [Pseudomonas promysalinigenes]UXH38230.1 RcnB family protein [Pseudomonas promysalinigenes]
MQFKHLLPALLIASLPVVSFAAPSAEESVKAPETHNRELKVGDKAPDQYKRDENAITNWKAKGLPAPEKESHWVRMGDHYVLIQITNGVVLAIHPAS